MTNTLFQSYNTQQIFLMLGMQFQFFVNTMKDFHLKSESSPQSSIYQPMSRIFHFVETLPSKWHCFPESRINWPERFDLQNTEHHYSAEIFTLHARFIYIIIHKHVIAESFLICQVFRLPPIFRTVLREFSSL